MTDVPEAFAAPLRLRLDGDALVRNWQTLARMSGSAACGAAVKAMALKYRIQTEAAQP